MVGIDGQRLKALGLYGFRESNGGQVVLGQE